MFADVNKRKKKNSALCFIFMWIWIRRSTIGKDTCTAEVSHGNLGNLMNIAYFVVYKKVKIKDM
jgi:hypothetical protein